MNFIDTIEIKNFKSIRHQKIEGCKKVNVFIGYPNVGKSNVLEALSLFSINPADSKLADFVRFEELPTLFFNGDVENAFEVRINHYARIIGYYLDELLNVRQQFTDDLNSFETNNLNAKSNNINAGNDWVITLDKSGLTQNLCITNATIRKGYSLLNTVKKYVFKKNTESLEKSYSQLVCPYGENLFSILSTHSEIRKDVIELFKPFDLLLNFDRAQNTLRIAKDFKDGSIFTLPYSVIADTLQRLIFHKTAIATSTNDVIVFEEPEANMFPPYIKKLTTDIILDKTNQFFIATHSPYVLDEFILDLGEDLSVYLVDYKDGETIVHHLSTEDLSEIRQYGVDLFFNIESYLKHGQVDHS